EGVRAGVRVGSAWPLAGTGCQNDGASPGWTTTARPRTFSAVLMPLPPRVVLRSLSYDGEAMNPWIETYRGMVSRWEVDMVDHFTVSFYFDRLADASLNALEARRLGPAVLKRAQQRAVTVDCYVRYLHELRAGDLLHVLSGVIAVDGDGLLLGHKLFDSQNDRLCATVEQRVQTLRGRR